MSDEGLSVKVKIEQGKHLKSDKELMELKGKTAWVKVRLRRQIGSRGKVLRAEEAPGIKTPPIARSKNKKGGFKKSSCEQKLCV